MTNYMNSSSLFMNAMYGMQNTYSASLQDGADSVTRQDLLDNQRNAYMNGTSVFSSYMSTNFMNLDSNSDGKIAADEMQQMMNDFSTSGMTYDQVMQLSMNGSIDGDQVSAILKDFNKIDQNGDGRVSMSEINYFSVNKEMEDKIAALKDRKLSNMSIMYDVGDDD